MDDKESQALSHVESQLEKALQNEDEAEIEKTNILLSTLIEAMIKTITEKQ